jgi:predicted phosphoribosyltransferase
MFVSREEAGQRLGQQLKADGVRADVVLGLARGGMVVAAEVARLLDLPLDVALVRKIGHPWHREFAVGALAENGVTVLDSQIVNRNPLIRFQLQQIIAEERERLKAYQEKFHHTEMADFSGKTVILVDDGIATGSTTEAAVLAVRQQNAASVIVAAPVASINAVERLGKIAEDVRVLIIDPEFDAVGRYYQTFSQTTDDEVLELLRGHASVR